MTCLTGGNKHNSLLLTAASALCWAVWITRNEVVFDKCKPKSFLQVLFRGTHWLRQMGKVAVVWCSTRPADPCRVASRDISLAFFLLPMDGCQIGLLVFFSQKKLYFVLFCGSL